MAYYVIIALDPAPVAGQYLEAFDFDAYAGQGFGEYTKMKEHAKRFKSFEEAFTFWRTQSTVKPIRPDGQANRPLTASTVNIQKVEDNGE